MKFLRMKKWILIPWYPLLLAAFPVLALLSGNVGQVQYTAGIRPLVLSLAAALILSLALQIVYRDLHRAAFAAAALVLAFFAYGQVYDVIAAAWKIPHFTAWMLATWLLLTSLALSLAALRRIHFESAAPTLNVVSLGLVLFSAVGVARGPVTKAAGGSGAANAPVQALHVLQGQTPPDIYYLMPEDYGRADLLQQLFHIDDRPFMQFLEDRGFYVAGCSQSNYVRSELSLGSALNMAYLQDLDPAFAAGSTDQIPIWNAIRYSAVRQVLERAGYKTVAFATGFAWSELDDSDIYLSPSSLWSGLTNFENLLLRTTPVRHLEDVGVLDLDRLDGERYRERTLFEFDSMEALAHMPGPKFVFVHIISPHPPFVFDADGAPTDPLYFMNENRQYPKDRYIQGFRGQVPFINGMLEKAITTLIDESPRPPVIILQTDTGPWFTGGSDQFKIINAYYMPGHTGLLYPGISPVNTFRAVFDGYLGADYPLLDDVSYNSPVPHIYDFSPVPNPCTDAAQPAP
jgi:hypothetical protein